MKGKNNIILDTKSNPSIREITISESLQPAPVKLKEQLILNNCACHNENGKSYSLKPFSRSKFKKASSIEYISNSGQKVCSELITLCDISPYNS